jgi:hypothetical protein
MVHGRVDSSEAGCEDMDASDVAVGEGARGDALRPAEPMGSAAAATVTVAGFLCKLEY